MDMNLDIDRILYADMQNALRHQAVILYEDERSLLLQDISSGLTYCTALDAEAAANMIGHIKDFDILVSHDEYCNQAIQQRFHITYENCCYHCVYTGHKRFFVDLPAGFHFAFVDERYMEDVIALYRKEMPELANAAYMRKAMDYGLIGVFHGDELAGFMGVHEGGSGSMGMLEVKSCYKRKGLGSALEKAVINMQLERGKIPYGEIFIDNTASLKLQEHVGLTIGDRLTYWFYK